MTHSSAAPLEAEPHEPVFTGETLRRLEALYPKYPTRQALLLPALWMVQEARGWVSEAAIGEVGSVLGLTPAYVKGVVTFYTMYHTHEWALRESGCGALGATSPDGRFTVVEVECLGACGFATPIIVDEDFIESVTPERVPGILARYQ